MDDSAQQALWTPPIYDLSGPPSKRCSYQLSSNNLCQGSNNNFARCAKIAPDGSSFIAQCEDQSLQIFDFPNAVSGSLDTGQREAVPLLPRLSLQQAAPLVDFTWFPSASKHDSAAYCFASSVRECPVKLLDANTGKLRASYRIVDHRERQIAPHSLVFTPSGEQLYCGFEDAIEVFDVARPGEGTRVHTSPSKKSRDGLKGIISALAFSNDHSISDDLLFAAGSLTPVPGNIGLYSESGAEALMFLGGGPRAGVTQLQFNLYRPHVLYAKYRGNANGTIYSWDIRSNIDMPLAIYDGRPLDTPYTLSRDETDEGATLERVHQTTSSPTARNQKSRFDLDIGGRYIGSGNWAGEVVVFDVEKTEAELFSDPKRYTMDEALDAAPSELAPLHVQPISRFNTHQDTVTSVTFQPWIAEMLTTSGSRHFGLSDEESSGDESDSVEGGDEGNDAPKRGMKTRGPSVLDSSIKLWSLSSLAISV